MSQYSPPPTKHSSAQKHRERCTLIVLRPVLLWFAGFLKLIVSLFCSWFTCTCEKKMTFKNWQMKSEREKQIICSAVRAGKRTKGKSGLSVLSDCLNRPSARALNTHCRAPEPRKLFSRQLNNSYFVRYVQ